MCFLSMLKGKYAFTAKCDVHRILHIYTRASIAEVARKNKQISLPIYISANMQQR